MSTQPLTKEAIALTEKKMDMALDDIIKMSKNVNRAKKHRIPNKSQKTFRNASQERNMRMRLYMDSRSSLRQGALARRRSNFQGNQFPFATDAARKAAVAPFRSKGFVRDAAVNSYRPRAGAPRTKNGTAKGGATEKSKEQQQGTVAAKQKPQTLDSLFANMKEQRRKTTVSRQNNSMQRPPRGKQIPPWGRAQFACRSMFS